MKTVPLSQGYITIVDDFEYDRAMVGPKWYARVERRPDGSTWNVYVLRNVIRNGKRTTEQLHRFLLGITDPKIEVDHRDGDGLNNCRSNLRVATAAQNQHNQRLRIDSTTGLKGTYFHEGAGKFKAQITVNRKVKGLGHFTSPYDAARAYDGAALEAFGDFAMTNCALGLLPKHPAGVTVQLPLQLLEAI